MRLASPGDNLHPVLEDRDLIACLGEFQDILCTDRFNQTRGSFLGVVVLPYLGDFEQYQKELGLGLVTFMLKAGKPAGFRAVKRRGHMLVPVLPERAHMYRFAYSLRYLTEHVVYKRA